MWENTGRKRPSFAETPGLARSPSGIILPAEACCDDDVSSFGSSHDDRGLDRDLRVLETAGPPTFIFAKAVRLELLQAFPGASIVKERRGKVLGSQNSTSPAKRRLELFNRAAAL